MKQPTPLNDLSIMSLVLIMHRTVEEMSHHRQQTPDKVR